MLCFYDEDKDRLAKKLDKTKKIKEISEATLLQKMVNTDIGCIIRNQIVLLILTNFLRASHS